MQKKKKKKIQKSLSKVRSRKDFVSGYINIYMITEIGLPRWLSGKEPACQLRRRQDVWVHSLGWEDPLE